MEKDYKKMYEDALNKAMNLTVSNNISALAAGEIFPELKESEDDRIRKEIIAYLDVQNVLAKGKDGDFKEWIAWLEKQGEQKPKVESTEHSYITPNSEFFQWIYDRLKYVYNENPNVDYMLSLKERIEDMQKSTECCGEDEKIKKAQLDYWRSVGGKEWYGVPVQEVIAWLEKQGEIDKTSYDISEKEKCEFIGDGFIKCYADFLDFRKGETYWLEYIGNDKYNVRSDNLLGKTYHITPCQLYTIFKKQTWLEKKCEQKSNEKTDILMSLDEAIEHCNKVAEVITTSGCEECAKEHKQLANWLTELKELKEQKFSWDEKIKGLNELETYILSLVPDKSKWIFYFV